MGDLYIGSIYTNVQIKKKMTNGLMDLFSTQMFYDFLHFNPYNTLNIRERSIYKLKLNSFVSSSVKEHK